MESQVLRPLRKTISVRGKMSYRESNQAWNQIRLRSEFLQDFPQLKEKCSRFSYKMVFYQEYDELEKAIKKLKKDKEALPFLLWLYKEKNSL